MNAFAVYWSGEFLARLNEENDTGPLTVLFGGGSIKLPALSSVRKGDRLYPVHIRKGTLYVLSRLKVEAFLSMEEYAGRYLNAKTPEEYYGLYGVCPGARPRPENLPLHWFPQTAAVLAAVGKGSAIRPRPVPAEALRRLAFGPKTGKERPLSLRDDKISPAGFSGNVRRLSEESRTLFEALFSGEAEL